MKKKNMCPFCGNVKARGRESWGEALFGKEESVQLFPNGTAIINCPDCGRSFQAQKKDSFLRKIRGAVAMIMDILDISCK